MMIKTHYSKENAHEKPELGFTSKEENQDIFNWENKKL
jgi:hypothetical protein